MSKSGSDLFIVDNSDSDWKVLTNEDIAHYSKIVVALTETIRLKAESDEVIEKHDGWHGAFRSTNKD